MEAESTIFFITDHHPNDKGTKPELNQGLGIADLVVCVALVMAKSPEWVMRTLTVDQAILIFNQSEKNKLLVLENQAAIIWAMASGKYKQQKKVVDEKDSIAELKALGLLKED